LSIESHATAAVSCATASFCAAVDVAGDALTYSGSWSAPDLVDSPRIFDAVSCASASFCAAVDTSGFAVLYAPAVVPCVALAITTSSLPNTVVHAHYSTPVAACGGVAPYKFTKIGPLPKGLRLSKSGLISGYARKVGMVSFGVRVTDRARPKHTATARFSITVT
jgi:hypothetical protein